jgi:soluble lytic murein transglycosylase-like protein
MSINGVNKQQLNQFLASGVQTGEKAERQPDFNRYLNQAQDLAVSSRPSSPEAKKQLETINSLAQLELMKLNSMLLNAFSGGGESGAGSLGGLSAGDELTGWLRALGLMGGNQDQVNGDVSFWNEEKQNLQSLEPWPKDMEGIVHRAAMENDLDPELIRAVIKTESNFDASVTSKAGAMGLMQLMPGTARDLGVDDPFDPVQNVSGGSRYLRQMIDRYSGDLEKALAAYNWGPGSLDRSTGKLPDETERYVSLVTQRYKGFLGSKKS